VTHCNTALDKPVVSTDGAGPVAVAVVALTAEDATATAVAFAVDVTATVVAFAADVTATAVVVSCCGA